MKVIYHEGVGVDRSQIDREVAVALVEGERVAVVTGLEPGELVFVLRSRDSLAVETIDHWYALAAPGFDDARRTGWQADRDAFVRWQFDHAEAVRAPD